MTDDYSGWRELLAGRKHPIHEGAPLCGFWRARNGKGGPWVPVAIWRNSDGKIVVTRNKLELIDKWVADCWLWCAKNPITEEVFRHHEKHETWPDDEPATMEGHNRPSDPYEALKLDIANAIELAKELARLPVTTQADADKIGNRVDDLRKLAAKAKAAHKAEKDPHWQAGLAVDGKYNPLIAEMTAAADTIKNLVASWAQAEQQRLFEERRQAEQERERVEAENRKRLEDAAKAIWDAAERAKAGEVVLQPFPERPALLALPDLPSTKVQIGGATGRRIGFRVDIKIKIEDFSKALRKFKDHPDLIALVEKLAQQSYDASKKVPPGCEAVEITRAS